jgi:hypothetical protein
MPLENRRDVLVSTAVTADRLGYDGYYLPETWAYDTTILLAEAALKTERIGLGTGILGVWNRSAGYPGDGGGRRWRRSRAAASRSGSASAPRSSPRDCTTSSSSCRWAACAVTIGQVRALLRGERIPLAVGHERASAEAQRPAAPRDPDLCGRHRRAVGAHDRGAGRRLGPIHLSAQPSARGDRAASRGRRARRASRPAAERLPSVPAVVAPDAAKAREGAAWFVAFYLVNMGTLYRQSLVRRASARKSRPCSPPMRRSSPAWCRRTRRRCSRS